MWHTLDISRSLWIFSCGLNRAISGVDCVGIHWYIISIMVPLLSFNGLLYNSCGTVKPPKICPQKQCTPDISRYVAISRDFSNIAQTLCPWVQGILILFSDFIWFIPYPDRVIMGVGCIGIHWYIISITSPLLSFNGLLYNFCGTVRPQTICPQAQCTLDISRSLSLI